MSVLDKIFGSKKSNLAEKFNDIKNNKVLQDSIIKLQNGINISADSDVIAITSPKDAKHSALIAKAMVDVYSMDKEKCLIVDLNMYNPTLSELYKINSEYEKFDYENIKKIRVDEFVELVAFPHVTYPTTIFKSSCIENFVKSAKECYQHIVLVVPPVGLYKDLLLLSELVTAVVLVTKKNKTQRKDIFDCVEFIKSNNLPFSGSVLIK